MNDYDPDKEFKPVEWFLCGNSDDNKSLLEQLELILSFTQEALTHGGHPDLDAKNVSFQLLLNNETRLLLRLPKKVKEALPQNESL